VVRRRHVHSEWQAARSGLDKREQTLRAELAAIPAPMSRIDVSDVRAAWPAMTPDERRELLRMFIARITIHKAKPGTRSFDPDRVSVEFQVCT
jgi:site-specific DNA recombinase